MSAVNDILGAMQKAKVSFDPIPTELRCSENYWTALRALHEAASTFIVEPKIAKPSFMGLKVLVDPKMTDNEWEVRDNHGRVLTSWKDAKAAK